MEKSLEVSEKMKEIIVDEGGNKVVMGKIDNLVDKVAYHKARRVNTLSMAIGLTEEEYDRLYELFDTGNKFPDGRYTTYYKNLKWLFERKGLAFDGVGDKAVVQFTVSLPLFHRGMNFYRGAEMAVLIIPQKTIEEEIPIGKTKLDEIKREILYEG